MFLGSGIPNRVGRIVNGSATEVNEYPWYVQNIFLNNSRLERERDIDKKDRERERRRDKRRNREKDKETEREKGRERARRNRGCDKYSSIHIYRCSYIIFDN